MKSLLYALALLVVGVSVVAQQPARDEPRKPAPAHSIDGSWTVISAEKNGQPMADAKDMTVTVRDNTITCNGKDGKAAMTFKVDFQKIGHAKVTDQSAGATDKDKGATREAVYVLTSDYLAVCVHDDKAGGEVQPASGTDRTGSGQPASKSYCTLVLKRTSGERK